MQQRAAVAAEGCEWTRPSHLKWQPQLSPIPIRPSDLRSRSPSCSYEPPLMSSSSSQLLGAGRAVPGVGAHGQETNAETSAKSATCFGQAVEQDLAAVEVSRGIADIADATGQAAPFHDFSFSTPTRVLPHHGQFSVCCEGNEHRRLGFGTTPSWKMPSGTPPPAVQSSRHRSRDESCRLARSPSTPLMPASATMVEAAEQPLLAVQKGPPSQRQNCAAVPALRGAAVPLPVASAASAMDSAASQCSRRSLAHGSSSRRLSQKSPRVSVSRAQGLTRSTSGSAPRASSPSAVRRESRSLDPPCSASPRGAQKNPQQRANRALSPRLCPEPTMPSLAAARRRAMAHLSALAAAADAAALTAAVTADGSPVEQEQPPATGVVGEVASSRTVCPEFYEIGTPSRPPADDRWKRIPSPVLGLAAKRSPRSLTGAAFASCRLSPRGVGPTAMLSAGSPMSAVAAAASAASGVPCLGALTGKPRSAKSRLASPPAGQTHALWAWASRGSIGRVPRGARAGGA
eukprot:TRINITY_DN8527_c0_g2_i1.p1 TRINITY_DN8527_c0_g2~~TRINITY_DN8527_c0_g2_i1.p1  ORF type:complete len:516 (+),score=72.57 TRINITY_DN8527_c0_g2_i1:139-1686(+)